MVPRIGGWCQGEIYGREAGYYFFLKFSGEGFCHRDNVQELGVGGPGKAERGGGGARRERFYWQVNTTIGVKTYHRGEIDFTYYTCITIHDRCVMGGMIGKTYHMGMLGGIKAFISPYDCSYDTPLFRFRVVGGLLEKAFFWPG